MVLSFYIVIQFQGKFENVSIYFHFSVFCYIDLSSIFIAVDV